MREKIGWLLLPLAVEHFFGTSPLSLFGVGEVVITTEAPLDGQLEVWAGIGMRWKTQGAFRSQSVDVHERVVGSAHPFDSGDLMLWADYDLQIRDAC